MKTKLTSRESFLVGITLFGMFFGAGNLIFPVFLGQQAGSNWLPATIGFVLTAVGIPILGVAAIGTTHSSGLDVLSGKVSKWYGYAFTCLLYLTIGPCFAIPRCATTTFSTGIEPLIGDFAESKLSLLLFSAVFFALVLVFSLVPNKITTWIGRIITPAFLIFYAILILTALIFPGAALADVEPAENYQSGALFNGFLEGYNTMDAIAGLAFGIVVIDIIRNMGVTEDGAVAKSTILSGIPTAVIMALIYLLTIIMGVQSRGLFAPAENGGVALAQIADHYFGTVGLLLLAITIFFACLKTAIGLVISCSEMFVHLFPKALPYKAWTVIFTVFSFGIANVGLDALIQYAIPVLMLLYPLAITLILLALTEKWFKKSRYIYAAVTAGAFLAAIFDFLKTLPSALFDALHLEPVVTFAGKVLPFFDLGFGWIVPALIGLVVGIVLTVVCKNKAAPRRIDWVPINKRSIGVCIILSLITFGIYSIYWEYLLVKNTRAIKKDDSSCTGEMLCLIFVPFYSLYWWFTRGKLVRDEFSKHGYSASSNETAFLVLALFGLGIVAMAIMQNDFNSLPSKSTQSDQQSANKATPSAN